MTTADLLRRVIDLDRLMLPPALGENSGSFVGEKQGATTITGPGVLTRIYAASPGGQIRITIDGRPAFDAPLDKLFNGEQLPFVQPLCYRTAAGGAGVCCFPIGFTRECRIEIKGAAGAFAVESVRFAAGVTVQPFTPQLDEPTKAVLTEVTETIDTGYTTKQLFGDRRRLPIGIDGEFTGPKKERVIREEVDGAGVIRALYIALTDRTNPRVLYALHACILRIYWDGSARPAVEVPLIDFFGSGFEMVPYAGLPIGTARTLELPLPDRRFGEDTFLYCHFPMPFANGAVIELENVGTAKFGLLLYAEIDRTPPPKNSLRFKACYRHEMPLVKDEFVAWQSNGPGRLVGCVVNIDRPEHGWWGGGQATFEIDETKKSELALGDLAALAGAAPPLHPFARPLHGVTRTGPFGKSSFYRWLVPDALPFAHPARLVLRFAPPGVMANSYAGVLTCWYGPADAKGDPPPLDVTGWAPPGLRIPGAVEIEGQVRGANWGVEVKQKYSGLVEFSGEKAVRITAAEPVQIAIVSRAAQKARLKLRVHPGRRFDTIEVIAPDGRLIGTARHATSKSPAGASNAPAAAELAALGIYDLGDIDLPAGETLLTIRCTQPAVLDCWIIEPR